MSDLHDIPDDVSIWALPTAWQHRNFDGWVDIDGGHDMDGNFNGFCRLHDRAKEVEGSAVYNFKKGAMRCQGDPCCHPGRRAMSLTNVITVVEASDA